MRNQFKSLTAGAVFTVFDDGRTVYGLKTDTGRAVNLHTGALFDVFPTKKVDAPDTIDRTFLPATRHNEAVFVRKLTSGHDTRYVCRSFLVIASEIVERHELTLPEPKTGKVPGVDILLTEIEKLASKVAALSKAAKALNEPDTDAYSMAEDYINHVMQSYREDAGAKIAISR